MKMKRYWFSIALPLFVAASIGTYYVGAATRDLPDYRLEKVEGDAKEAANLVFDGVDKRPQNVRYELQTGANGTSYEVKKSMFAQMRNSYSLGRNTVDTRFLKEHKDFVRGNNNLSGYFGNKEQLAYAEAIRGQSDESDGRSTYSLTIRAQDLKSGVKKRFEAILPGKPKFSSFYVYDVQASGGQLKILVQLSKDSTAEYRGGRSMSEIHLYTVDTDKEGIIDDRTIASDKELDGGKIEHYSIYGLSNDFASPSDHVLIAKSTVRTSKDANGYVNEEQVTSGYSSYRYSTAELTPLAPDSSDTSKEYLLMGDGKIAVSTLNAGGVSIAINDSANRQTLTRIDFPMATFQGQAISGIQKFVYGDRLYLMNHVNAAFEVVIVDMTAGKVVYRGKIAVDGTPEQQKERMKQLDLYGIYLSS